MIKNNSKIDYSKLVNNSQNKFNYYTIDNIEGNCNLKLNINNFVSTKNQKNDFDLQLIKSSDPSQILKVKCKFLNTSEISCFTKEKVNDFYRINDSLYEEEEKFNISSNKEYEIICEEEEKKKTISTLKLVLIIVFSILLISIIVVVVILIKRNKKKIQIKEKYKISTFKNNNNIKDNKCDDNPKTNDEMIDK